MICPSISPYYTTSHVTCNFLFVDCHKQKTIKKKKEYSWQNLRRKSPPPPFVKIEPRECLPEKLS